MWINCERKHRPLFIYKKKLNGTDSVQQWHIPHCLCRVCVITVNTFTTYENDLFSLSAFVVVGLMNAAAVARAHNIQCHSVTSDCIHDLELTE